VARSGHVIDRPVLIPTSEGPIGGIVSEPPSEARAKLILLQGYGRPARSGTNSFWTHTARDLAGLGAIVLRIDYSREGETLPLGEGGVGLAWKSSFDLSLLRQVVPWFSERAGEVPLLLAGACAGTRLSVGFAAANPGAVAGVFSIALDLRPVIDEGAHGPGIGSADEIDPLVVEQMEAILERAPSWVLVGDRDVADIPRLKRLLGPTRYELELEVVPDAVLHFLDQPDIQEQARRRLVTRVAWALAE
jgi:dienelactone hydrolase